ncbi:transposase family protein [Burkholderia mallei]|nr:transposase family protein [Burkholderia mallei]KOS82360.1 transposase family protein [Burkholderia mallei]KOS82489.1 transposase family protein [Burkholderia mallei]KOS82615.1 transposase family protein [Burkholderia mallei]KOS82678.1 transposase family protein [Burkholderia mallei]
MKKRFTEQQIIGFLKEAEAGMPVKELCRKHGFSDASFYTWRASSAAWKSRKPAGSRASRWRMPD